MKTEPRDKSSFNWQLVVMLLIGFVGVFYGGSAYRDQSWSAMTFWLVVGGVPFVLALAEILRRRFNDRPKDS